jgi:large repetitive protein
VQNRISLHFIFKNTKHLSMMRIKLILLLLFFSAKASQAQKPDITWISHNTVTAKMVMTIKGHYFTGTTSVTLSNTPPTSWTVLSDSVIEAVVSHNTPFGNGRAIVTNPYGSDTSEPYFYINPNVFITSYSPTSGGAGTVVLIRGNALHHVDGVQFGGVPAASFQIISDSVIQAVVGAGASGNVTVRYYGRTAWATGSFTFVPPGPPPVINSISPTVVSAGFTIAIKGRYFTGANAVTIGGLPAMSFSVLSDTTINARVAPNSWNNGYVIVSTPSGRDTADQQIFYVPVDPIPSVSHFTPTSGPAGTVVTIYGNGLWNTQSVTFGGVPAASFEVISEIEIRAVVGAGATGLIGVSKPTGSGTSSQIFTVPGSNRVPVITSVTPTQVTQGDTLTIQGRNFTGTQSVLFFGVTANWFTVVSDSVIRAQIHRRGLMNVIVNTPLGSDTASTFVRVWALPVITDFTPTSGTDGTQITIYGYGFLDVSAVVIGNTYARSVVRVSDSLITAIASYGTGTTSGPVHVINAMNRIVSYGHFTFVNPLLVTNPAIGSTTVTTPVRQGKSVIRLLNTAGVIIKEVSLAPNTIQTRINLSGVAPGSYIIWWGDGKQSVTRALLVK